MVDVNTSGAGVQATPYKDPEEGGTPKTGYDSAPKGEFATFGTPGGIGGTGKGAH